MHKLPIERLEWRTLLSVLHVDANSPASTPTGATWATAFQDLQQALVVAGPGDQVWVADGTYKPTTGTDRTISFRLTNGVVVRGGYAGISAPLDNPDLRNISDFPTILSGDIGTQGTTTDNTIHVVDASNTTIAPTIDGCTITAGYAQDTFDVTLGPAGPAIMVYQGKANISHCIFTANVTQAWGPVTLFQNSTATITDCLFIANTYSLPATLIYAGGAIVVATRSQATISRCSFVGNSAGVNLTVIGVGGAIAVMDAGSSTITDCTFTRNVSSLGGGLYVETASSASVTNCTFNGNTAIGGGGAMLRPNGPHGTTGPAFGNFTNCTFVGNTATGTTGTVRGGGALLNTASATLVNCDLIDNSAVGPGGGINCLTTAGSSATITNSIVRGNTSSVSPQLSANVVVTYCDVEGGFAGTGNVDANADFVRNPSPGDDNTWRTDDDDYGDLRLQITSACIDSGNNAAVPSGVTTDLGGNPRFYDFPGVNDPGAIVDMGAYELNNHLGLLHVASKQTLALPAGRHVFFVEQLQIDAGGTLDVRDDDLIIDYTGASQLAAIQSMINSARMGNWSGTGIASSAAKNNSQHNTTLAAMEASDYKSLSALNTNFDGEAVDNTAVLISYTYYGDANFNGKVDGADYSRIDATFNAEHTAGNIGGWLNGDFNGDGKVDGADYGLIDGAFNSQGAVIPGTGLAGLPTPPRVGGRPSSR